MAIGPCPYQTHGPTLDATRLDLRCPHVILRPESKPGRKATGSPLFVPGRTCNPATPYENYEWHAPTVARLSAGRQPKRLWRNHAFGTASGDTITCDLLAYDLVIHPSTNSRLGHQRQLEMGAGLGNKRMDGSASLRHLVCVPMLAKGH